LSNRELEKWAKYARVAEVFTPGAPINSLDLFAGRIEQIKDVLTAVSQRGQHVVLYGERGVGKTSLANILDEFFAGRGAGALASARINCGTTDDFYAIWEKVFRELEIDEDADKISSPDDLRHMLKDAPPRTLIVIDELDRLEDDEALTLMSDTIKSLSDHSAPPTLMLVGVADSVEQIVGDHRSVERALVQVQMPRMSLEELMEAIDKGTGELGMGITAVARARIARLSEGLPYYTHLLCQHAFQRAVIDARNEVWAGDIQTAVELAVQKAQHSIRSAYQVATRSPRKDNLFNEVLVACALAPKDDLGYFPASGVREPLARITGRNYDIPAFARHLKEFASEKRGNALIKSGTPGRTFYRFENPLLQPFTILHGLEKGLVTEDQLVQRSRNGRPTSEGESEDYEVSEDEG
jgi:energy-coupling factor transporter ATP-binding protein EcfA2